MKNNEVTEAAAVAWLRAKRQVSELIDSPRKESLLKILFEMGFVAGVGHASKKLAGTVMESEVMPRESAIVGKIIKAVRKEYPDAYVRKIADRFTRGLADVIIVFLCDMPDDYCLSLVGKTLFVEAKTDDGKTSKIQDEEHRQIRRAGGEVIVARTAAEVVAKMREMGATR